MTFWIEWLGIVQLTVHLSHSYEAFHMFLYRYPSLSPPSISFPSDFFKWRYSYQPFAFYYVKISNIFAIWISYFPSDIWLSTSCFMSINKSIRKLVIPNSLMCILNVSFSRRKKNEQINSIYFISIQFENSLLLFLVNF